MCERGRVRRDLKRTGHSALTADSGDSRSTSLRLVPLSQEGEDYFPASAACAAASRAIGTRNGEQLT